MKTPITAEHQRWLGSQLPLWQDQGWIDAAAVEQIEGSYELVSGKRLNLARLLLSIGGAFVGIGVIWLVAANLDALSPMVRLGAVFALYAAALVGAEWLAGRRAHQGSIPSPVVHAMRIVATLLLGGVIFQAAQSMHVPAYDMTLLGLWSLGGLLHAYLMRTATPLLVALPTGFGWAVAAPMADQGSWLAFVVAMFAAALLATGVAQLPQPTRAFTLWWRETGAAAALVGLFAAAIPSAEPDDFMLSTSLVVLLVGAAVALGAALWKGPHRLEPAMVVLLGGLAVLLVFWQAGQDADNVDLASWAHASLSVAVYVGAALWVAYLGIVHDSVRLTIIATAALVIFTTFQAFAVFAQIIQGAWLFVFLGLVLAGTGYVFDKARRELAASVEGEVR